MFAQRSEFGILVGGSRRFIESGDGEPIPGSEPPATRAFLDNEFSLSNSAIDLYWAIGEYISQKIADDGRGFDVAAMAEAAAKLIPAGRPK